MALQYFYIIEYLSILGLH